MTAASAKLERAGALGSAAIVLAVLLTLLWPAAWLGRPTSFADSSTYYNGGAFAVARALDVAGIGRSRAGPGRPASDEGAAISRAGPADEGDAPRVAANVRSVPYSVYAYLTTRLAGPLGPVVPVAAGTAWLIWLMTAGLGHRAALAAGVGTAALTTAPLYASQYMPDILAAWLIMIPIVLVRRLGGRARAPRPMRPALLIALAAMALFATLSHYAHIPLAGAMGVGLAVVLWRRARARGRGWPLRRLAAWALLPLAVASAVNLALSALLPGGASVTPARLPLVLARSLADGPAVAYLERNCGQVDYAICEVYDTFPTTVAEFLWADDNVRARATPDQMARISAEELSLVWAVFRFDPLGQTRALVGNVAEQFVRFGLGDMGTGAFRIGADGRMTLVPAPHLRAQLRPIEWIERAVVAASALALAVLAWRRPGARVPVGLLVLGLLANAAVCGGLSAPADRYQGRVIWLTVLLAATLALERRPAPGRSHAARDDIAPG